jgi:ATP-dependent Zn protease
VAQPTAEPQTKGPDAALQGLLDSTGESVLAMRDADVGRSREVLRLGRWRRLLGWVAVAVWLYTLRRLAMDPGDSFLPLPHVDPVTASIVVFFAAMLAVVVGQSVVTGRSPHVVFRPDQLDTRLADVVGIDPVKEEVVRTLNLFLAHKTFEEGMGGRPRRGILFEGPPGTGKTHLARAMAAEAGVPFLFASGTSFQTVWQGQSSKKIRSYFKALRKAARKEGGAIGFIEELDVVAAARSGVSTAMTPLAVAGCSGTTCLPTLSSAATVVNAFVGGGDTSSIVNELLVQMQSFDSPTGAQRLRGWLVDRVNLLLPLSRQLKRPEVRPANVLIIAATNRASSLDPALLRPGRFDRRLAFELPAKSGRRALVDHFMTSRAHAPELDDDVRRDALAAITTGFTPAMLQNLCDEALVNAVRRGDTEMTWEDLERARLSTQVGVGQPVEYTEHERRLIATHEAGHATLAWLTAPQRRLEILTIIKRQGALGLLAHGDREDVYTRSRAEMQALIQIAFGGQCAEEIFFGDVSTGPGGDLLYATNAAAEMVGAHGMDDTLISFLAVQNSALSDTNIVGRVLADPEGRAAVEALLVRQKSRAKALLEQHTHLVEALRDALLEHEELIGDEITDVLEAAQAGRKDELQVIDLREPSEPRLP